MNIYSNFNTSIYKNNFYLQNFTEKKLPSITSAIIAIAILCFTVYLIFNCRNKKLLKKTDNGKIDGKKTDNGKIGKPAEAIIKLTDIILNGEGCLANIDDINTHILSFLPIEDLGRVHGVCRALLHSTPKERFQKLVTFDFGYFNPDTQCFVLKKEVKELSYEQLKTIVKNTPDSYMTYYGGMGSSTFYFNMDEKCGSFDSESINYQEEVEKEFTLMKQKCFRILTSKPVALIDGAYDRINGHV